VIDEDEGAFADGPATAAEPILAVVDGVHGPLPSAGSTAAGSNGDRKREVALPSKMMLPADPSSNASV
jgi:hypothetical protein